MFLFYINHLDIDLSHQWDVYSQIWKPYQMEEEIHVLLGGIGLNELRIITKTKVPYIYIYII